MAFCKKCGAEVSQFAANCSECGESQQTEQHQVRSTQPDDGGFLWGLLGFCVPIVGLILFLVWNTERPRTAKAVGLGALINVIFAVIMYILYFIFIMIAVGAGY